MLIDYFKSRLGLKEKPKPLDEYIKTLKVDLTDLIINEDNLLDSMLCHKLNIDFTVTQSNDVFDNEGDYICEYKWSGNDLLYTESLTNEKMLFALVHKQVLETDEDFSTWLDENEGHMHSEIFAVNDKYEYEREIKSNEPILLIENNVKSLNMIFKRNVNDSFDEFLLMVVSEGILSLFVGYVVEDSWITAE